MLFRQNIALPSFQYKGNKTVPEKLYDMKKPPAARLDGRRFLCFIITLLLSKKLVKYLVTNKIISIFALFN